MGAYQPKKVFYDKRKIENDPTPYHKYLRLKKECLTAIQINIPQKGYIWGFDERSMFETLGTNYDYYATNLGTSAKKFSALLMGPAMFAFRNIYAWGILCWVSEFAAGLLEIKTGFPALTPMFLFWHLWAWLYFNDCFMVRLLMAYRERCQIYMPIPLSTHQKIHSRLKENPFMAAVYIAVELLIYILLRFIIYQIRG